MKFLSKAGFLRAFWPYSDPMNMIKPQKDPLHGVTLEQIVTELSEFYGWKKLGNQIAINCFKSNPSIKSSLTFLRRHEWARKKVEGTYLDYIYYDKKR